jgi:hypothetical protein
MCHHFEPADQQADTAALCWGGSQGSANKTHGIISKTTWSSGDLCFHQVAILRHASTHFRQASAHSWQCVIGCFAHSSAHDWPMSAHKAQMAWLCSLPRDMAEAASAQTWAQSMSSAMQRTIILTSVSWRHEAIQRLQATAHALQASIQALNFWGGI